MSELHEAASDRAPGIRPRSDASDHPIGSPIGHHRVLGKLTETDDAEIFVVRDTHLGRDVTLKVLRPGVADDQTAVERLLNEARTRSVLGTSGVPPIFELGLLPDGRPYFTTELGGGSTLAAMLAERDSPHDGLRRILGILEQICRVVGRAHRMGVVHRGLTAGLVRVGEYGRIQVEGWSRSERTAEADARDDVRDLGVILMEILTGRPPAGNATEMKKRLARRGADPELASLALSCLDPDRGKRPADGSEIADRLGSLLTGVAERVSGARETIGQARDRISRERKTRKLATALLTSVLLLGVAVGGYYLWTTRKEYTQNRTGVVTTFAALELAEEMESRTQRESPRDLGRWLAVREAAEEALRIANSPDGDDTASVRAGSLLTRAEGRVRALETVEERTGREQEAVARLEALAARLGACDPESRVEHARVLEGYLGFPVLEVEPDRFERAVIRSAIREDLLRGICRWALDEEGDRLRAALGRMDGDDHRVRVLKTFAAPEIVRARRVRELRRELEAVETTGGTLLLLGTALGEAGDLAGAVECLRSASLQNPGDYYLHVGLAHWLARTNPPRPREALAHLSAARALRPGNAEVLLLIAAIHLARGEAEAAVSVLDPAMTLVLPNGRRGRLLALRGAALLASDRASEAKESLTEAVSLARDDYLAWRSLGDLHLGGEAFGAAANAYLRATELRPDDREAHLGLIRSLHRSGRAAEAVERYRVEVADHPKSADSWLHLGLVLELTGAEEAAVCFDRARSLDAGSAVAAEMLGAYRLKGGDADAAFALFSEAASLEPGLAGPHRRLGAFLASERRDEAALAELDAALALMPGDATVLAWRGLVKLRLGESEAAVADFERSLDLDANCYPAWLGLGSALHEAGRGRESRHALLRAVDLRPSSAGTASLLFRAFERAEILDKLEAQLRAQLRAKPDDWAVRHRLGLLLEWLGHLEAGEGEHRRALESEPEAGGPLLRLGLAAERRGELEAALECYRKAEAQKDLRAEALSRRGLLQLESGRFEEALGTLRLAHGTRLADPSAALETGEWLAEAKRMVGDPVEPAVRARLCGRKGRHEVAVGLFREAFEEDPELLSDATWGNAAHAALSAAAAGHPRADWLEAALTGLRSRLGGDARLEARHRLATLRPLTEGR